MLFCQLYQLTFCHKRAVLPRSSRSAHRTSLFPSISSDQSQIRCRFTPPIRLRERIRTYERMDGLWSSCASHRISSTQCTWITYQRRVRQFAFWRGRNWGKHQDRRRRRFGIETAHIDEHPYHWIWRCSESRSDQCG